MSDYDYSLCSYVQLAMTNEDFRKIRNFPLTRGGELADPESIWETGDGRKILPKDMDTRHIMNVLKFLMGQTSRNIPSRREILCEKDMEAATLRLSRQIHPIFKHLESELKRRANGVPRETRTGRKIILED